METFNVHEAKTRLSELLSRVEQGEEFILARGGKAIARLSRLQAERKPPGYLDPQFRMDEKLFQSADAEIRLDE